MLWRRDSRRDEVLRREASARVTGAVPGNGLDGRLGTFIDHCLASVADLEVLLFLSTSTPLMRREVARRMAFAPTMVDLAVEQLGRHGLVAVDGDGRVHFSPRDASVAVLVADLANAYRLRRTAVIARIIRDRDSG